jgi:hypothetical protein
MLTSSDVPAINGHLKAIVCRSTFLLEFTLIIIFTFILHGCLPLLYSRGQLRSKLSRRVVGIPALGKLLIGLKVGTLHMYVDEHLADAPGSCTLSWPGCRSCPATVGRFFPPTRRRLWSTVVSSHSGRPHGTAGPRFHSKYYYCTSKEKQHTSSS